MEPNRWVLGSRDPDLCILYSQIQLQDNLKKFYNQKWVFKRTDRKLIKARFLNRILIKIFSLFHFKMRIFVGNFEV